MTRTSEAHTSDSRVKQTSEPIFNIPPVVSVTIGVMILVHAVRVLVLTPHQDDWFLLEFAFIPQRYTLPAAVFPGGLGAEIWTFVTHAFIHANLLHIGVNIAWLLPFGTAVARRFGTVRFLGFFAVSAAAGALAHLATHWGEAVLMVGASGAISGLMAAAMRFVFQRGGPIHLWDPKNFETYQVPAEPLLECLRDRRVLVFLLMWFGLNLLMGAGGIPFPGVEEGVAWQAHIGGFLAGLLLFPLFDPVARNPVDGDPADQER
jgi:membrane associated rhomboid family serine protease